MQRLERAVTRLEQMSVTMQAPSGMANGGCVNGIDGGRSWLKEKLLDSEVFGDGAKKAQVKKAGDTFELTTSSDLPLCF